MQLTNVKSLVKASAALFMSGYLAVGCGIQHDTPQSKVKIYGGNEVEPGEWNSTVAITHYGRIYCTGTIVHPRLVITAAHCLSDVRYSDALKIYMGPGKEGGRIEGQFSVSDFQVSPEYSPALGGWNDLAYILTEEPLPIDPSDIVPILVNKEEVESIIQTDNFVKIVGYGGRDGGGFGLKYEAFAPITSYSEQEVSIGADGRDSCQGDSGGPAYGQLPNGEWRVFGVVSRGGPCGYGGIWGRMSAGVCWIAEDTGIDLNLPRDYCR